MTDKTIKVTVREALDHLLKPLPKTAHKGINWRIKRGCMRKGKGK